MSTNSRVSDSFRFENSVQDVYKVAISVLTRLGRGGPKVDRLLGKVAGPIKKQQVPSRQCMAEINISVKAGIVTMNIIVTCEHDEVSSKIYSLNAFKLLVRHIFAKQNELRLATEVVT